MTAEPRTTADPARDSATIHLAVTEAELRVLARAASAMLEVAAPFAGEQGCDAGSSTLATARGVLVAAGERYGVDLGLIRVATR